MSEIEIKTYSLEDSKVKDKENTEKKVKSSNGLRKGAYSVIFAYLAFVLYLNPFSIDFIPYGVAINKTLLIPESFYLLFFSIIFAVIFSLLGTVISLVRMSFLGFALSFIIFGNVSYFSAKAYAVYKENPVIIDSIIKDFDIKNITSKISIVKKSDLKTNIK